MPPVDASARLLSNDVLLKWLLEDFPYRIQLAPVLPFLPVAGDALRYATTGPLTPGVTIGQCDAIPDDTKRPNDPNRVHRFAQLATQFRVCYKAQDIFSSNVNDQVAVQMALAVRELLYKFWTLFERGDASANPDEFDGLHRLVHPAHVRDLKGRPLETLDLHWAKEQVRSNDGRCAVIFTGPVGKIAILEALYARGANPDYEEMEFPNPAGGVRTEQVLKFDGAPVYVNDLNQVFACRSGKLGNLVPYEALHEHDWHELASHIWIFIMGPGNLHGIMPAMARNVVVRSTILPDASTLVYHLTMPIAIALGSVAAIAVIKNAAIPRAPGQPVHATRVTSPRRAARRSR
jgi:hypothetical protein